jgi:hypothetical protein
MGTIVVFFWYVIVFYQYKQYVNPFPVAKFISYERFWTFRA